ncbi:MAG: hypothetical protein QNJ75_02335 [Acidimicrobiia bacterium]|nr:hypothetical protein [Acidimicrobiia bacterium]
MLDGVEWAAAEIVFYMLLATLVGFAIAYVFIRWFQKESFAESFEADLAAQQELTRRAEYRLIDSNEALDKVHLELKGEQQRVSDLHAELESTQASLAELEAAGSDESGLGQLKADLEAERQESAVLQQRLTELESANADCEQRRAELEAQVAELEHGAIDPAAETDEGLEEPDGSPDEGIPSRQEGLDRIAEIAARTAGDGPVADDDLKKVHGIGPKLERTLKELGISSFRQIANFETDDIVYVTAALAAFKGRIERDDWMGSAAAEHLAKYGESP